MLSKPLLIAILFLASTTALFAYLSYSFYGDLSKVKAEVGRLEQSYSSLQIAYDTKEKSCLIDDSSVVELEIEKKELVEQFDDLTKQLNDLKKKGPLTKKPTIPQEPSNEKPTVLSGDELLSDELARLLLSAFCIVEPTDRQCIPPGIASDRSLQGSRPR